MRNLPFSASTAVLLFVLASLAIACDEDADDGIPTQPADDTPAAAAATPTSPAPVGTPIGSFADCERTGERSFTAAPGQIIDTSKTYVATITTAKGDIVVELFSDTPITTNNFVFLACTGFYDGLAFHRVVADFVIQGGGAGGSGPGYTIPDEDDGEHVMDVGVISMAKSSDAQGVVIPDSAGSQFFIVIGPRENAQHLDPDFAVFGRVTSGQDVAGQIVETDVIQSVTIVEQ